MSDRQVHSVRYGQHRRADGEAAGASGPVDVLLVNPPAPDGGIWIRSQYRVGRRSREGMVWPQVDLAQLAAMLHPDYSVGVVDAIAERMGWPEFTALLDRARPRYYVTQVTAPTLTNDMYGAFLARAQGARTIAFGTHVTPLARETMAAYPALDHVVRGEPELTLRELVDVCEGRPTPAWVESLLQAPARSRSDPVEPRDLAQVRGLVWRDRGHVTVNDERPLVPDLDQLPMPMHHLLPLSRYRMPMLRGPYGFVVTSRGCPAACRFCIKHVTSPRGVRLRSPEKIMEEIETLYALGVRNIHMYADLFTAQRDQVTALCEALLRAGLRIRWTCNSRVDTVDPELLRLMGRAGCWLISWGIESANPEILRRVRKGYKPDQVGAALAWSHAAGIRNWGYFIIGLPGETVQAIDDTIALAKRLPLDLALFHIAAPHPGTPFYDEVMANGWLREGVRWEEVDMDRSTVLNYPNLSAEELEHHAQRAFRAWALRPGPMWTYLKSLNSLSGLRAAVSIGVQHVGWMASDARTVR